MQLLRLNAEYSIAQTSRPLFRHTNSSHWKQTLVDAEKQKKQQSGLLSKSDSSLIQNLKQTYTAFHFRKVPLLYLSVKCGAAGGVC